MDQTLLASVTTILTLIIGGFFTLRTKRNEAKAKALIEERRSEKEAVAEERRLEKEAIAERNRAREEERNSLMAINKMVMDNLLEQIEGFKKDRVASDARIDRLEARLDEAESDAREANRKAIESNDRAIHAESEAKEAKAEADAVGYEFDRCKKMLAEQGMEL